ncbi:MAG: class I tRNA ligase family protein, partial [Hydrogenobaculum sp.]
MKIKDFLKENKLSMGDNVRFLLEKLGKESLENTIESKLGEAAKMSKSKANTIDPAIAIEKYGADTIRLYILFAAPPEQDFEWIETSIEGVHRFLKRVFNFVTSNISIL